MVDSLTRSERSERMSRVRGKDTGPEMIVRRIVYGMGYRYRLHRRDLPGRPDLSLGKLGKAIFVHGCFWHRHDDSSCKLARLPKSRLEFWLPKLDGNRERDARNIALLQKDGWQVLVVWECELKNTASLRSKIQAFLKQ